MNDMNTTIATKMIKPAIAALLLSAAPALAEGVPYAPCDYPGQYAHCPAPTPQPNPTSNTNTNTNAAGAIAGASAGAISGSSSKASVGNVSAKGGRGGNASSVSHGGSAKAAGGKAVANGGRQRQGQNQRAVARGGNQSARTGNLTNVNNYEEAAHTAIAPSIAGCGGTAGGGFSAAIQTFGFGVSAARCKGDRFRQVVDAEELAAQGRTAGMAYLAQVDGSSRKAFRGDVVDIRKDVISTAASAACQVVSRHANGAPKEVRAYPKPGRTKGEALASCLSVRGLFLVGGAQ